MVRILEGIIKILATIFIALCLVYLFVTMRQVGKEIFSDRAKNSPDAAIEAYITFHDGDDIWDVAQKLEEKRIINNKYYFTIALHFYDDYNQIKPGDYKVNSSMKPSEILQAMLPKETTE